METKKRGPYEKKVERKTHKKTVGERKESATDENAVEHTERLVKQGVRVAQCDATHEVGEAHAVGDVQLQALCALSALH